MIHLGVLWSELAALSSVLCYALLVGPADSFGGLLGIVTRREAKMADIRIDADKAERMIAQILRDEKGMLPADANAVAANICRRLTTAMPMPTNQPCKATELFRGLPQMVVASSLPLWPQKLRM